MKILICGPGPLGSVFASYMHRAGIDVTVLARGKRYEFIKQNGIIIENFETKQITTEKVRAIDSISPDEQFDIFFVIMRKNQALLLAKELQKFQHNFSRIFFLGNNVLGFSEYEKILDPDRIVIGFAAVAGHVMEDQKVLALAGDTISIVFGQKFGMDPGYVKKLTDFFRPAGVSMEYEPEIDSWLKFHAALIIPLACGLYRTDGDLVAFSNDRALVTLTVRGMKETMRILKRAGFFPTPRYLRNMRRLPDFVLVSFLRKMLRNERARVALAMHAKSAHDEMVLIACELRDTVGQYDSEHPAFTELMEHYL
ncbi:MAG: hypothetical protein JW874_13080 [Spirochaetales bacterium]|nr:hypothetical protein [Spirochaetales bacterium]